MRPCPVRHGKTGSWDATMTEKDAYPNKSAICIAAENGDLKSAKVVLQEDPTALSGEFDDSPLLIAIRNGHSELVKLLLEHGADPDESDENNYGIPAQTAMWKGYVDIVCSWTLAPIQARARQNPT